MGEAISAKVWLSEEAYKISNWLPVSRFVAGTFVIQAKDIELMCR
jgi:hypothetical protein